MPRPPIDLHSKVRDLLDHHLAPFAESAIPILHLEQSLAANFSLIKYVDDHVRIQPIYESVYERHMSHLRRMVLGNLVQSFERFLKEIAAVCVDQVAPYVYDGRFDKFETSGNALAGNFEAESVGRALCEASTWLNNDSVNARFRDLLKLPFGDLWQDFLFPGRTQHPENERETARSLAVLWQVRHNIAHNVGLLTRSDAYKLRALRRGPVASDRLLSPDVADLRFVKRFLWETAERTNARIGDRLGVVLTEIRHDNPAAFNAQTVADEVSRRFDHVITVDACVGVL
jgi:hypothetical protein